jgi:hypothetical protein
MMRFSNLISRNPLIAAHAALATAATAVTPVPRKCAAIHVSAHPVKVRDVTSTVAAIHNGEVLLVDVLLDFSVSSLADRGHGGKSS